MHSLEIKARRARTRQKENKIRRSEEKLVRIKVIRNGSPPLAIAQPNLLSLHSDILATLMSIYSANQILDP